MPSDTVWVAAIGALSTVSVTGVSLWLQGRNGREAEKRRNEHDERVRAEDRAWSLRLQDHPDRRQLHARLLKTASRLHFAVGQLKLFVDPPRLADDERLPDESTIRDNALDALHDFSEVLGLAAVEAVDRSVLEAADEIYSRAGEANTRYYLHRSGSESDVEPFYEALSRVRELLPVLRDACRRDLGYDNPTEADTDAAES